MVAFSDQNHAAQLCSSEAARPRLEKITGLKFKSLKDLAKRLPVGVTLVEPLGLKTGEIWIRFPVGERIGWLVIDAFCGSKMTSAKQECQSPELLKTFPSYGIENRDQYKDWVLEQIEQDQPTLIIPCHGSIVRNSKLAIKLEHLVAGL